MCIATYADSCGICARGDTNLASYIRSYVLPFVFVSWNVSSYCNKISITATIIPTSTH